MSVKSGSGLRYQPHSTRDGEVDYQRTSQTGPDIGKCLDEKLQYALNLLPSRADYDTMQAKLGNDVLYTRLWKINRPALLTGAIMDPYSKLQRLNWLLYLPAKERYQQPRTKKFTKRVVSERRAGFCVIAENYAVKELQRDPHAVHLPYGLPELILRLLSKPLLVLIMPTNRNASVQH
jgi:hypothetical protein